MDKEFLESHKLFKRIIEEFTIFVGNHEMKPDQISINIDLELYNNFVEQYCILENESREFIFLGIPICFDPSLSQNSFIFTKMEYQKVVNNLITESHWIEKKANLLQQMAIDIAAKTMFYLGDEKVKEYIDQEDSSDIFFWYSLKTYVKDLENRRDELKFYRESGRIINSEYNSSSQP